MLTIEEFVKHLPKVELHVHLEGSITAETLLKLADRNGLRPPFETPEDAADFYAYRDFSHFIETFLTVCGYLRKPEDYYVLVRDFLADAAAQNILHREAFFSPTMHLSKPGLSQAALLEALEQGIKDGGRETGVELRFITDISRQFVPEADAVVDFALAGHERGFIIGVGIGGAEAEYPPRLFERHMDRARAAGLHSVVHAGEAAGPESVWEAIRTTKAERIGHGVRSVEDPRLVEYLRESGIPLEVCPTSNLCTGVYRSYAEHPLRTLHEAGVRITVGSDDPPLFGCTLTGEYEVLAREFGFTREELGRIALNGVEFSFMPTDQKDALRKRFLEAFAGLGI